MASYALMKDPGRGTIYPYANNWDAHKIYGCVCDPGYTGSNCMKSEYTSALLAECDKLGDFSLLLKHQGSVL